MAINFRIVLLTGATALSLHAMAQYPSRLALGFEAGGGGAWPTASLHDNFGGCFIFNAGLNAQWHNAVLKVNFDYGQPSTRRQNIFDVHDASGHDAQINANASASQFGLNVQLGYSMALSPKLSITPAAGMRYTRCSWDVNDIEWDTDDEGRDRFQINDKHHANVGNANWMVSVAFDLRLHDRYVSDAPLLGGQCRYTSSVRLTPWLAHAAFGKCVPKASGYYVGFTITYAGMLSKLTEN